MQKGTHTVFWLQGINPKEIDGTANDGAEIDVFESAYDSGNTSTATVLHRDGYGSNHVALTRHWLDEGYYVFDMLCTPDSLNLNLCKSKKSILARIY